VAIRQPSWRRVREGRYQIELRLALACAAAGISKERCVGDQPYGLAQRLQSGRVIATHGQREELVEVEMNRSGIPKMKMTLALPPGVIGPAAWLLAVGQPGHQLSEGPRRRGYSSRAVNDRWKGFTETQREYTRSQVCTPTARDSCSRIVNARC